MAKTSWQDMTRRQKAVAHLAEARHYARKAAKARTQEVIEDMCQATLDCLYYAEQWGAKLAECNKVRAIAGVKPLAV